MDRPEAPVAPGSRHLGLALGGTADTGGCWLFVALAGGRAAWGRLLVADEPMVLQELFAVSPDGDLSHPSEVPLDAITTPAELVATVAAELGPAARVIDVRLHSLGPPALTFTAHDERSVRLEAGSDVAFAPRLARLGGESASAWASLLALLRYEGLTEQYLRVALSAGAADVKVYSGAATFAADAPNSTLCLELGGSVGSAD